MLEIKDIIVREIDKNCNVSSFSCLDEETNEFFYEKSIENNINLISKVFILENINNNDIIGFFTLSAYRLNLPHGRKYGIQQVPAVLLGRIAIDNKFRGKNLTEKIILRYAIGVCNEVKKHIGCRLIIAEIKLNDPLYMYCKKRGFFVEKSNKQFHFMSIDLL